MHFASRRPTTGQESSRCSSRSTGPKWSSQGLKQRRICPRARRTIQYSAGDAAGNTSQLEKLTVGVDHSAPLGWFEPPSEERPTLISATVTDAHSGIGAGLVEYRLAGGGAGWTELPTRIDPVAGGDSAAKLTARFPDFSLPRGTYDLRVRSIDNVGNVSEITNRFDGLKAMISTPVREQTRLTFAFEHRRKSRCSSTVARICKSKLTVKSKLVDFGRGATTEGQLVDGSGKPLVGRTVTVLAQRTGTKLRTPLRSLTTDSRGRFRARVKPGVNRRIVARFDGGGIAPAVRRSRRNVHSLKAEPDSEQRASSVWWPPGVQWPSFLGRRKDRARPADLHSCTWDAAGRRSDRRSGWTVPWSIPLEDSPTGTPDTSGAHTATGRLAVLRRRLACREGEGRSLTEISPRRKCVGLYLESDEASKAGSAIVQFQTACSPPGSEKFSTISSRTRI